MAEQKPIEGEVLPAEKPAEKPTEEPEFAEEQEGFGAQVDEFLRELNLSRKHIWLGLGCVVLAALLIFGGFKGYEYYSNRKQTKPVEPAPQQKEEKPMQKEETGMLSTVLIGHIPNLQKMPLATGIASTLLIGQEFEGSTTLAGYILLLRRLQNAYETDIQESLSKATDRAARFESHLALLNRLHEDALKALQSIRNEEDVIRKQFEPQSKKQESSDINFFEQVGSLNPETSQKILNDFISASREVVSLRAKFKALQKIQRLYEIAVPRAERRMRDIVLNREALITGIKVYDVSGSDLKLVQPVQGEDIPEEERLGSPGPAYPLIPVEPSQLKGLGGKDFISEPGGGLKFEELRAGEKDFITKPQQ